MKVYLRKHPGSIVATGVRLTRDEADGLLDLPVADLQFLDLEAAILFGEGDLDKGLTLLECELHAATTRGATVQRLQTVEGRLVVFDLRRLEILLAEFGGEALCFFADDRFDAGVIADFRHGNQFGDGVFDGTGVARDAAGCALTTLRVARSANSGGVAHSRIGSGEVRCHRFGRISAGIDAGGVATGCRVSGRHRVDVRPGWGCMAARRHRNRCGWGGTIRSRAPRMGGRRAGRQRHRTSQIYGRRICCSTRMGRRGARQVAGARNGRGEIRGRGGSTGVGRSWIRCRGSIGVRCSTGVGGH